MRRSFRDQGLSLFFFALFVTALLGQSLAGYLRANEDAAQHAQPAQSYLSFVFSSEFVVDVAENWQSEFLAVGTMVAFSVFLRQRGSAESKPVGLPDDVSAQASE